MTSESFLQLFKMDENVSSFLRVQCETLKQPKRGLRKAANHRKNHVKQFIIYHNCYYFISVMKQIVIRSDFQTPNIELLISSCPLSRLYEVNEGSLN